MSKHTKGSWKYAKSMAGGGIVFPDTGFPNQVIATVHPSDTSTGDGALIAASPELYRAASLAVIVLERLVSEVPSVSESHLSLTVDSALDELHKALTRAEVNTRGTKEK